jgi:hypothetical protein
MADGGMREAESLLDQVLVSADDPITSTSVADLLGLADGEAVDAFIDALTVGDVLVGVGILDRLEADGRDLVAFSEQLVVRLRERLVAVLSRAADGARAARPLADAARRLTGIDASRSGIGGYRWQLELALLEAAEEAAGPSVAHASADGAPAGAVSTRSRSTADAPVPPTPLPLAPDRGPHAVAGSAQVQARDVAPSAAAPAAATMAATSQAQPEAARVAVVEAGGDDIEAIRAAWPRIVAAVARNPANRPLVTTCRPVEIRDGFLVLGFPEDQAFLRDIAERKRTILETGIASVVGRPVAVRCIVTNLELVAPVDGGEGDLVAQAARIFGGELAGIEDID